MARPRVFVSSTYYDLKSVRADLEHFIKDRGYDPVLNERGHVTYSKESAPSQDCYKEIESCEILVSIIGGRLGSASHEGPYSISQLELKTAIDNYKQVYIFVERDVLTEYRTYLANKNTKIKLAAADDIKIYQFLEEILSLPNNNPVMAFETSHDILTLLREQWAGLFQRMLQQSANEGSLATARELRQGIETVQRLVELLQSQSAVENVAQEAVKAVLTPNHPAFRKIKRLTKTQYRVYFTNLDELNSWLKVRGFESIGQEAWDSSDFREWYLSSNQENWDLIKISTSLFDEDGRFDPNLTPWSDELMKREVRPREIVDFDSSDDDDNPF